MERKLAERLAAKAAAGELSGEISKEHSAEHVKGEPTNDARNEVEAPPDSGVRQPQFPVPQGEPSGPLSYQVYNVAELEARSRTARATSMLLAEPVIPSRWPEVRRLGLVVLRSAWNCYQFPKPRPRLVDMCRLPLRDFATELKAALRALPWKKIAFYGGVGGSTVALLLFTVLIAAELTDDLKPTAAKHSLAEPPAAVSTPAPVIVQPAPEPTEVIDLDEPAAKVSPKGKTTAKPYRKK
jgi:hypothetical protein